jgi:transcriptional regulator with XRE-family HTH domain
MDRETIGQRLKRLREENELSQPKLSELSGVQREYISQIENGKTKGMTLRTAEALAKGLNVPASVFFENETYQPLSEKLKIPGVVKIPIYTDFPFHAGDDGVEPSEFAYREAVTGAPGQIEGYIVRGTCLEPEVKEGDTIFVDRELAIENGDIVACQIKGGLHVARLKRIGDEQWLVNNEGHHRIEDCQVSAVVVEINRKRRRLK